MRVGLIIFSFLATVNCGLLLVLLLVFGGISWQQPLFNGPADAGRQQTVTAIVATNNFVGTAIAQTATARTANGSTGSTVIGTSTPTNTPTITLTSTPKN
jgi:hypothetical protein